jgi:hypothetical protein
LQIALCAGFIALAVVSGRKVHQINVEVRQAQRPLCRTVARINRFLATHQREPGFSFAFDPSVYDQKPFHGIPLPLVLYKRHVSNHNPRYIFDGRSRTFVVASDANCSDSQPRAADLVRVGTDYNFYRLDGCYYGISPHDGFYRPGRHGYHHPIKARSLEAAVAQVPAMLVNQEVERRSAAFRGRHGVRP